MAFVAPIASNSRTQAYKSSFVAGTNVKVSAVPRRTSNKVVRVRASLGANSNNADKNLTQLNMSRTAVEEKTQTKTERKLEPFVMKEPYPRPVSKQPRKQKDFVSLLADRANQIVADKQYAKEHNKKEPQGVARNRVVVVGSGWAAQAIANAIDTTKFDLVIVSPRNHYVFTPMLASSSVGSVEFRSICQPIRQDGLDLSYYEAKCTKVLHEEKKIVCVEPSGRQFEIPYNFLVMTVGSQVNTFGIPGVEQHLHFLKEIPDAQKIRRAIVDRFERANLPDTSVEERKRLLHFVVVGGGPTGVELCAEVGDLLRQDLAKLYPKLVGETSLTLLEAGPNILMQFKPDLQQTAKENLILENVDVRTGAMVVKVDENKFYMKDGSEIEYGLGVWAAGVGAVPLIKDLIAAVSDQSTARGRLLTDEFYRVKGVGNVFALGDCAQCELRPLPMTGQVAAQQGIFLARLLNRHFIPVQGQSSYEDALEVPVDPPELYMSKHAEPFQYLKLGTLAYIGGNKAISQVEAGDSGIGINVSGFASFLIWRFIYLSKLFSGKNRINVLIDWMRAKTFGRDISQF